MASSTKKRKIGSITSNGKDPVVLDGGFNEKKSPQTPFRGLKMAKMVNSSSPIMMTMMKSSPFLEEEEDHDTSSWGMSSSSPLRSSPLKTSPFQSNYKLNRTLNTNSIINSSSSPIIKSLDTSANDSIDNDGDYMIKYINLSPFVSLPNTAQSNYQTGLNLNTITTHKRLCVNINDYGFANVKETFKVNETIQTPILPPMTPYIIDDNLISSSHALKYIDPYMTTIRCKEPTQLEGYNTIGIQQQQQREEEEEEEEEEEYWDYWGKGNLYKISGTPLLALKKSFDMID